MPKTPNKATAHFILYLLGVEVLDDAKVKKTNVITQSEGAFFASLAAYQQPERFGDLVLTVPAGMIGGDSILKLAGRFGPNVARSSTKDLVNNPAMGNRINLGVLSMIGKHPVESMRRVSDLAGYTLNNLLYDLHSRGVKVGIIQANRDSVFPSGRMEEQVDPISQFANVCSYASFVDKQAGHQELMINSENAGLAAIQMLDDLKNREIEPRNA